MNAKAAGYESLFLKEAHVLRMGEQMIPYLIAGAPFLGLVYLSTNFHQAVQKAASAIVISLLRQGLLLIPLLYLFHTVLGLVGIAAILFAATYRKVKKELL